MIRPLGQTDYMVTKRLFQEVFSLSEDSYFPAAWATRDTNASVGYWNSDVLIGAAIVKANKLEYIFMNHMFRGNGIGTHLLHTVIQRCPNLHLTPVDDPNVRRWYAKHGFRMTTEINDYRIYTRHTHNVRRKKN
jgi:GNAT superfamily N-acetyltransferase